LTAPLSVVSLCAGVEGFGLGLERAGMRVLAQVEIDKFCNKVLDRRFPHVVRYRDVREFARGDEWRPPADVDVVTGGFPCQDVSVAGRRAGLDGARSGLFFEFVRIVDTLAPEWVLFENVAGLLSSKSAASASLEGDADADGDDGDDYHAGEDFAVVLGELTGFRPAVPEDGWRSAGICIGPKRAAAWRLFDSQYFGVAQRRKRVFLVCHARAEIAGAVLLDAEGGAGDPPPKREAGETVAGTLGLGNPGSRGVRSTDLDGNGAYIPEIAYAVRSSQLKQNGSPERGDVTLIAMAVDGSDVANTLKRDDGHVSEDGTGRQPGFVVTREVAVPLTGGGHPNSNLPSRHMEDDQNLVATYNVQPVSTSVIRNALEARPTDVAEAVVKVGGARRSDRGTMAVFRKGRRAQSVDDHETWISDEVANTVTPFDQGDVRATSLVADDTAYRVRRLTVTEQERLQGFPDGWTCLEEGPYNSFECRCPDGPRVGAIGNAVTVNVAEWIGRRMVAVAAEYQ
jgi:DNA (cytosine-5)-methyltransferase 1